MGERDGRGDKEKGELLLEYDDLQWGALVQFGCYQHRYEWKGLWCSSTVWLSTQT